MGKQKNISININIKLKPNKLRIINQVRLLSLAAVMMPFVKAVYSA